MIELAALSAEKLRPWLAEPSGGPRAYGSVIGVSVGYDEAFVRLVNRTPTTQPPGTVEHSAIIASRLAAGNAAVEGSSVEPSNLDWDLQGAVNEWRRISDRRHGRPTTPIRVEITVSTSSRREGRAAPLNRDVSTEFRESHEANAPFDDRLSTAGIPISVRPSRGARLQLAASGGRLRPSPSTANRWGTLGGFLRSSAGELFAMTAAHVLGGTNAVATPAFQSGIEVLRRAMQSASLRTSALGAEVGRARLVSVPQELGRGQCQFQVTPATGGLDYALAAWPDAAARKLTTAPAIELGEVSQVLKARFVGARSGRVNVRVTRYSVWHAYDLDDTGQRVACIADCFEVALDQRPYVRTDVSRGGDSGAWLICDGADGPRWLGLLVGGDGDRTGVVPAYRIRNDLRSSFGAVTSMI